MEEDYNHVWRHCSLGLEMPAQYRAELLTRPDRNDIRESQN